MYLKRLTISNYKSFFEPTAFDFEQGFNVLLGANSSGKSSVLEAIAFHELADTPHRTILNVIDVGTPLTDSPSSELSFKCTLDELSKQLPFGQDLFVGVGDQVGHFYSEDIKLLMQRLSSEELVLDIRAALQAGRFMRLSFDSWPSMWRPLSSQGTYPLLLVRSNDPAANQTANFGTGSADLDQLLGRTIPRIYKFSAERAVQHVYGHHPDSELLPSSANLAYCVNHLQSSNPDLADELNRLLHRVFPTIHWVGAPGNPNHQFELKVHTNPSHMKRGDLAIPINRVGTGVANAYSGDRDR